MSMIKIENLTFCYPACGENVFENLNAVIDTEWKLALVGRNGRGKTTLLKLLHGEYEYGGKITGGVRFDYFPYAVKYKNKSVAVFLSVFCSVRLVLVFIKELSSPRHGRRRFIHAVRVSVERRTDENLARRDVFERK